MKPLASAADAARRYVCSIVGRACARRPGGRVSCLAGAAKPPERREAGADPVRVTGDPGG